MSGSGQAMHPTWCMNTGALNHVRFRTSHDPYVVRGGGSRIRTHVPFRGSGFQDRRLKPLGHPSGILTITTFNFQPKLNYFSSATKGVGCARSLRSLRLPTVAEPTSQDLRESRFRRDALS